MKSFKKLMALLLVLGLCMALCACDIRSVLGGMFGQNEEAFREENSFFQEGDSDIQLQPAAPTEKYQYIVGPDGNMSVIIGGIDGNGGIHFDTPGIIIGTLPAVEEEEETSYAEYAGVWQCLRYDPNMVYDGHTGGSATTWYLCENGYAVCETSDGEIDVNRGKYYLNYTNTRVYGPYSIVDGVFTFIVEEDWMYASASYMGDTYVCPIYTGSDGFVMIHEGNTRQYNRIDEDDGDFLKIIRAANGGPTGNNQYDPNWTEPVISHKPLEGQVGKWVAFTDKGNGRIFRQAWEFTEHGDCYIEEDTLYMSGGSWVTESYGDNTGGYYYFMNGQLCVEVGPDIYGMYDLTINGDTMTMHYFDWNGKEITTTFIRYTGTAVPVPN